MISKRRSFETLKIIIDQIVNKLIKLNIEKKNNKAKIPKVAADA